MGVTLIGKVIGPNPASLVDSHIESAKKKRKHTCDLRDNARLAIKGVG